MTLNRSDIMTNAWKDTREHMRMGYAAHQLREVFTYPQMHIDSQRDSFERYQRTMWAERDLETGTVYQIVPMERVLA